MTHLIVTGGTIDKQYMPLTGELGFGETHIHEMLERARLSDQVTVEELLMLDSLDMTDEHRLQIAAACEATDKTSIVITHGTDTMVETARTINASLAKDLGGKTIVLTGAMVPYSINDPLSDAMFNLGTAIAHARVLPSGVWISMNGQYIDAEHAAKDKQIGMFVNNGK